ncbi:hypothetical protein SacN8_10655 [Sulfolobus acidocaldarius N8]|uniref:Uncharacterized protein n=2 Tax=Sulfolobus acidocaldarius TaxID=2285 RepID=M1JFF1_9CREN|nr:hypothetical protein SacN8_10655 [Sulfolobus acidocaldarius N8]AGE74395.1 hypothetical protein SacRon12I_10905 [Sulfolobus acidocaldarius Ron12/I]
MNEIKRNGLKQTIALTENLMFKGTEIFYLLQYLF